MTNPALAQFLRRIPSNMTGLAADVETAFKVVDNFADKASTIRRDPTLSPVGQAAKIAEALDAGPRAHLKQLADKTAAAIENIKARRAALAPQKPRDDSTIGEMRRAELRAYLRSMESGERLRSALSGDPEIEDAIIHGAAALSGLSDEIKGRIVAAATERAHGPALATLDAEAAALSEAASAIATAAHFLDREAANIASAA